MPILADNKKALFDYQVVKTWEAGLILTGQEVKSVRNKQLSLKESYVVINLTANRSPQAYLLNCHISPYKMAGHLTGYDPTRTRRLLLHQKEINSLYGQAQQAGLTLIPLRVYTKGTKIKVEIGLVKGKKQFDKRTAIKKREVDRELRRKLKNI
ncbi:MAG: SsrA-binding protein SmpB [Patescibacteria group bacterium]